MRVLSEAEALSKPQVAALQARLRACEAQSIVAFAVDTFPGRIALTSSFGAESAVLLHLASRVAPHVPVLFLDTGKLFPETIAYRETIVGRLGLTAVRIVSPDPSKLKEDDPSGYLWSVDPDRCCAIRKVEPLSQVLTEFSAWITGRKRFQGGSRSGLPAFERDGRHVKVNPLAAWSEADIENYLVEHNLPRHPLAARGYRSIGCTHCTSPTLPGEDARAGRWRNKGKTECGIHRHRQVAVDGVDATLGGLAP
ncbi:MAG: phosphoadenylyl-sulfate reductase [Sphingomonadales bacterium]|nr:phosphoadenylyl-sulfate reductase [Sphingomonadales bacterium]